MPNPDDSRVVSWAGPSKQEELHNETLAAWCASRTEPIEESDLRRNILEKLSAICKAFIKSVMITEYRMPPSLAEEVGGRIFTTGSYRHNVHTSGSDIDVVLIAPEKIRVSHFFTVLVDRLRVEPWVSDIVLHTDAFVPIIAMKCEGIDIDLSFGTIKQPTVPDDIPMLDDNVLRGLDEKSVRGANAVRVAQLLIDLVPEKATFRQVLRFVKAWGKNRGLYSSKFGYPTGIGWAILTAKVCQSYPNLNAAGLVYRFFRFYKQWFRPNPTQDAPNRAIFLTESLTVRNPIPGLPPCWNPRSSNSDAQALFPVITPAYPYANSCYNVTRTTLRILCEEFARGEEIVGRYLQAPVNPSLKYGLWEIVLEKYPFFQSFKYFLHVTAGCKKPELFNAWVEGVEAKLRMLWYEGKSNRGCALEAYPQVKVHVFSATYQDPQQTAALEAYKAREKARATSQRMSMSGGSAVPAAPNMGQSPMSSTIQSKVGHPDTQPYLMQSPGTPLHQQQQQQQHSSHGAHLSGSASKGNATSSTSNSSGGGGASPMVTAGAATTAGSLPSGDPTASVDGTNNTPSKSASGASGGAASGGVELPAVLTAHFYIGLELKKEEGKKSQIELGRIVANFQSICTQLKGYTPDVTLLPTVNIERVETIPSWVTGISVEERKRARENGSDGSATTTTTAASGEQSSKASQHQSSSSSAAPTTATAAAAAASEPKGGPSDRDRHQEVAGAPKQEVKPAINTAGSATPGGTAPQPKAKQAPAAQAPVTANHSRPSEEDVATGMDF